jgi:uncharacterized membrane protein YeaQ/YmgE (transglycosylase-associated protein family)
MDFVWTIIIGLIVGALARLIMPGKDAMGLVMTAILGIVGALVITVLGRGLGFIQPGSGANFVWSVIGAVIVLFFYRRMKAGKA